MAKFATNVRHDGDFYEAGEDVPEEFPEEVLAHLRENGAIEGEGPDEADAGVAPEDAEGDAE
jgi:hypothetical protein